MFKKLVSNLPYSPSLIGDIGFYANRLRGEEVTRRTTVLFVVLALIMQSLAVFSPPESANASSEQDIIPGGVRDIDDFLIRYDRNTEDIKDIYSTAGISRNEIAAAQPGTIDTSKNTYIMSRYGQLSGSSQEVSMPYQRSAGGMGVRYFSPLASISGNNVSFKGWIGKSATLGWFGIIQSNASLATKGIPTSIDPVNTPNASATKTASAKNLSQNTPLSDKTILKPLDRVSYTLKLSNPRPSTLTDQFDVRIADILEYATLVDGGGGSYNSDTGTLSWAPVTLTPGQSQERTFIVQLQSAFAATATGSSDPTSYDCRISISFGNQISSPIDCPPVKNVEGMLLLLPPTDIWTNLLFSVLLLVTVVYFYIRTRQLKKEIRIIRHNFNTGII